MTDPSGCVCVFAPVRVCVCMRRPVLRRHVPVTVPVGSELSARPHAVSVLGAALQAAARRPGHSGQAGCSVERWRGERISCNTHAHTHTHTFPSVEQPSLHCLFWCCRSSGLCRILSAVRTKRASSKMRWEKLSFWLKKKIHILIGDIYFITLVLCWIVDMRILPTKGQDSFDLSSPFYKKKSREILCLIITIISYISNYQTIIIT